jgi:hypothetical protein
MTQRVLRRWPVPPPPYTPAHPRAPAGSTERTQRTGGRRCTAGSTPAGRTRPRRRSAPLGGHGRFPSASLLLRCPGRRLRRCRCWRWRWRCRDYDRPADEPAAAEPEWRCHEPKASQSGMQTLPRLQSECHGRLRQMAVEDVCAALCARRAGSRHYWPEGLIVPGRRKRRPDEERHVPRIAVAPECLCRGWNHHGLCHAHAEHCLGLSLRWLGDRGSHPTPPTALA